MTAEAGAKKHGVLPKDAYDRGAPSSRRRRRPAIVRRHCWPHPVSHGIDAAHADFAASGPHGPPCVNCSNLYMIRHAAIARTIGSLSVATMIQLDECLKALLGII